MKKFWQRLVLFGLTGAFFVSCISCSAANTASKVPILMYHNLTNDPSAVTSMTITGEPGIYETDEVGIRIENELECIDLALGGFDRHPSRKGSHARAAGHDHL